MKGSISISGVNAMGSIRELPGFHKSGRNFRMKLDKFQNNFSQFVFENYGLQQTFCKKLLRNQFNFSRKLSYFCRNHSYIQSRLSIVFNFGKTPYVLINYLRFPLELLAITQKQKNLWVFAYTIAFAIPSPTFNTKSSCYSIIHRFRTKIIGKRSKVSLPLTIAALARDTSL